MISSGGQPAALESSPLVSIGTVEGASKQHAAEPTSLDEGGELPLFTWKHVGVFLCPLLNTLQRGIASNMALPVFTAYLNAPPNVIAASSPVIGFVTICILVLLLPDSKTMAQEAMVLPAKLTGAVELLSTKKVMKTRKKQK